MSDYTAPDTREAACAGYDTEQFFVEGLGSGLANKQAKAICNGHPDLTPAIPPCPIREACLAWALELEGTLTGANRYGVYGGMTAPERAKFVRKGMAKGQRGAA